MAASGATFCDLSCNNFIHEMDAHYEKGKNETFWHTRPYRSIDLTLKTFGVHLGVEADQIKKNFKKRR